MSGLVASGIAKSFAGTVALDGVSLRVGVNSVMGLIGPNGSGKTTLLNVISGVMRPDRGSIRLDQVEIARRPAHRRALGGLARTFQNIRLFKEMTVAQNCAVAVVAQGRKADQGQLGDALSLLGIERFADEIAGSLPYGTQRRVELARAIAVRPRYLLLDEPAAGMNDQETVELVEAIQQICQGYEMGVLIVEHNLGLISALCDAVTVLDAGTVICEGTPREVRSDPGVIEAYIGRAAANRSNKARQIALSEEEK